MAENDVILQNELLEVIFEDKTQVVLTGAETFDVLLEAGTQVLIDNNTIEVLTLSEGPRGPKGEQGLRGLPGEDGKDGTKVTVSMTPPPSPKIGDLWIVKH